MCFQWSREERKGVLDSLRPTNLVKDFGEVLFSILAVGSRSHLGIFAPLVPCFDRFQTLPPHSPSWDWDFGLPPCEGADPRTNY
jgi:hypothetical protein